MKQIQIGTCVPGDQAEKWLPAIIKAGFECISLNFHMTLGNVKLEELAPKIKEQIGDSGVRVASIGYYCNALQYEEHKETLKYVMDCAHLFDAPMVSTFAGAVNGRPVEESIPVFKNVYGELAKYAADKGLKIGFENCPMGSTWQCARENIAFNARSWELMFDAVPDDNIGLEWEPAHQICQLVDPLANLRKWVKKVVHLHGKDETVDWDAIRTYGILGAADFPGRPMVYNRTPGFGETDWRDIITILRLNGYEGDICVEGYHDPVYSGEWEFTGQLHALQYLKWCRGGDFAPNPWNKD